MMRIRFYEDTHTLTPYRCYLCIFLLLVLVPVQCRCCCAIFVWLQTFHVLFICSVFLCRNSIGDSHNSTMHYTLYSCFCVYVCVCLSQFCVSLIFIDTIVYHTNTHLITLIIVADTFHHIYKHTTWIKLC